MIDETDLICHNLVKLFKFSTKLPCSSPGRVFCFVYYAKIVVSLLSPSLEVYFKVSFAP